MGRCKDCYYFRQEKIWNSFKETWVKGLGSCRQIENSQSWKELLELGKVSFNAVYPYYTGYAIPKVGADFGCIHFERRG